MNTSDRYLAAMQRAIQDGNPEAAAELRSRAQSAMRDENQPRMGSGEAALVGLGSGLTNVWEGAKSLVGQSRSDPEKRLADAAMRNLKAQHPYLVSGAELAGEIAGGAPVGMPAAGLAGRAAGMVTQRMLPRALAALSGAGAAEGALTEGDSLKGAAMGAVAAPVMGGMMMGAPRAVGALMGRQGTPESRAAKAFQEAYSGPIPDQPSGIAPQTTAQLTRDPHLLSLERSAKEGAFGPDIASPVRDAERGANAMRWEHLDNNLPTEDMVKQAKEFRDDFANKALSGLVLTSNVGGETMRGLAGSIANSAGPTKRALMKLESDFREAVELAGKTGSPAPLHSWRKQIGDEIGKANARGESALAGELHQRLFPLKDSLDRELNQSVRQAGSPGGDKWKEYVEGYQDLARIADQAEAGLAIRRKFESRARDSQGNVQTGTIAPDLRKLMAQGPENRYGREVYSPETMDAINRVGPEVEASLASGRRDVSASGSRTAENLDAARRLMGDSRMSDAASRLATPGRGALFGGLMTGDPSGAVHGAITAKVAQWAMRSSGKNAQEAAKLLMGMVASPDEARRVLAASKQRGVPSPVVDSVERAMDRIIGGELGASAVGGVTRDDQ